MTKELAKEFRQCVTDFMATDKAEQRAKILERAFVIFDKSKEQQEAGEPEPYKGEPIETMYKQLTQDDKLFFIAAIKHGIQTGYFKLAEPQKAV